jgi:hypothetical protein
MLAGEAVRRCALATPGRRDRYASMEKEGGDMKRMMLALVLIALAAAGAWAAPVAANVDIFRGEVWTWDENTNVLTLRQLDGHIVRLQVAPGVLDQLRLHQIVAVRGELAPPAAIEHVIVPAGPMTAEPQGRPVRSEITGTITGVDPAGTAAIGTSPGPLRVWVATPVDARYRHGAAVRLRTKVQRVRMVPTREGAPEPSASVGREPGDYAVVVGRVAAVGRDGRITVESPRGPVTVEVPQAHGYAVGETVEVHTRLQPIDQTSR